MSEYAYVSERAKKAFASVSRLESLLQREPSNRSVEINLASMRKMALQAKEEMYRLSKVNNIEVCQYKLIPVSQGDYGLGSVAKSLLEYQNLFSQVYDKFKNGKKTKASIGKEAAQESSLDFAYSYSGSLGVVLLAKSERDFFDGNLDQPISSLYEIMDIDSAKSVRSLADDMGIAVVKRVHDWSLANANGGFSADIRWKRSDGKELGQVIDSRQMERIVEYIDDASDEKTSNIDIEGMLVAVSLPKRSFQIIEPEGEVYSGYFHEEFNSPDTLTVGVVYNASIEVLETTLYATQQVKVVNKLVSLEVIQTLV